MEAIDAWLEAEGADLVGQEAVTLSTTPAFERGRLVPRPMSLRVFLARTPKGWQVMPGGFARIGRSDDATAIAMQRGGSAADVWVVSERPVEHTSLLPSDRAAFARLKPGVLPSRAGDNLFWLGRYVERAEAIMRFVRAYHIRLAETDEAESPLIRHLGRHLASLGIDSGETLPGALTRALESAVISAGHVRDRFSPDGWTVLNDLAVLAGGMRGTVAPGDETARAMGALLRRITGFSGLVHENMYRSTGWRFLSIGRSLERAIATAGALAALAEPEAPEGALDLAVEIGDSVLTHRRRYSVATSRDTVVDLLALDSMNPRSVLYQLTEMRDHIGYLPDADFLGQLSELSRAMLRAHTGLAILTPDRLDDLALGALRAEIEGISDLIGDTYLR
jgi:uncharacterized alpha-E superfamily protein